MAINFDSLPDSRPSQVLNKGLYIATITNVEMRTPKDTTRPQYLNVTYELVDKAGKGCGKFWDILTESDSDLMRYKLKRFLESVGIPISGEFELVDLTRVLNNKQLVVYLAIDEKGDRPRNQVDLFTAEPYYPIQQWASLTGSTTPVAVAGAGLVNAQDDLPFDIGGADY